MANEVLVSANGDLFAPSLLARSLELLLHRKPWMRDACVFQGDTRGSGADTIKVPQVGVDDVAESVAEGSGISATTALTDGSYTLTPARLGIKREVSDKFNFIQPDGMISIEALAEWNHGAVMRGFDGLACAALANFTGTVGSSGNPLTLLQFQAGYQTLMERDAAGQVPRMLCVLHEHQFGDLQKDLLNYNSVALDRQDVKDMVGMRGETYKGTLLGVEIWTSNQVIDANTAADHNGAMFIFGGLNYAQGSPKAMSWTGGRMIHKDTVVYTTFSESVDTAEIAMATNAFYAVSVGEAAKGIKVITDHV